ncbi:capsule assembly Wzi family protein [Microbacter margulisiae]|uniref:Capsule assembly protein Wzi n=1 Tax=Microbacter margulisiae TaxID=1350067 RepID=A0A7W5DQI2_9PORP|nr:capsule assembly Wzi family protein [Microbacter margulisiae]MBB3187192.1 hypothetical protein [Microbacter margulisiae]
MKIHRLIPALIVFAAFCNTTAQTQHITYNTEFSTNVGSGGYAPFWLITNKDGIPDMQPNSAYLRAGIFQKSDTVKRFSYQYGVDLVKTTHTSAILFPEQFYVNLQYHHVALHIGSQIRNDGLQNRLLSSCGGGTLWSGNARPLPEVAFVIPDFITVFHRMPWLKAKAEISYGWLVDNGYQLQPAHTQNEFVSVNGFLHRKMVALQFKGKSPWSFTALGEVDVEFGGNQITYANGQIVSNFHNAADLKHFLMVMIPFKGDKSAPGVDQAWFYGNYVGDWQGRLTYDMGNKGQLHAYLDNYFEDSSGLWKLNGLDGLWGIEYDAVGKKLISGVVVEYYQSTNQSGPIMFRPADYNYKTNLKYWTYGDDNYYNHSFYIGWSNYGRAIGSPIVTSPIYNQDGNLTFEDNRVRAYHIGLMGYLSNDWSDRLLATYREGFGTMSTPFINPQQGFSGMLEVNYTPHQLKGFSVSAAAAFDRGALTGNNWGCNLTLKQNGILDWFRKTEK